MIYSRLPELLYGGDYHPELWPESIWPEDVSLMKRAGVNCMTLGSACWAKLQPAPDTFSFDWLDRAVDLLHSNGIRTSLATATALIPPWLAKRRLDSRTRGSNEGTGGNHTCPNDAAIRECATRLVRELASRYGRHEGLISWQIDGCRGPLSLCSCDACSARFRVWLQQKYRTLDALNENWSTASTNQCYGRWEEILPPDLTAGPANPGHRLDYRRFINDSMLGELLAEKSVLRELTPNIPVIATLSAGRHQRAGINCFEWARHADAVALAFRPDRFEQDPADTGFACELYRGGAGDTAWLLYDRKASGEFNSACAPWRPRQSLLWKAQALARGAAGVKLPQWRTAPAGPDQFDVAMLPAGGTETRAFRETEEFGAALRKLGAIRGAHAKAEVALVVDWENFWALDSEICPAPIDYLELLRSYYRALFEPDIAIDILPPEAELAPYKLVVVPGLHLVREGIASNLAAFVDNGGTMVMTFFSGFMDATGRRLSGGAPGPFRKLLGIRLEEFDPFPAGQMKHFKTSLRGAKCSWWADVIELEGAESCATFTEDYYSHRPAITCNAVGHGLAYYIGTHPEPSFLRTFLADLCNDSGVRPPMRVPNGIEVTTRTSEQGEFLFLLNHASTMQFVDIGPRTRRDLLTGEMIHGQCQLEARGVRVLQLA